MSDEDVQPRIVRRVTRKHAAIFAKAFVRYVFTSGAVFDAFAESGVMEWPQDTTLDNRDAAHRYMNIEDEIAARVTTAIREQVERAFFDAATDVLNRERQRRATPEDQK